MEPFFWTAAKSWLADRWSNLTAMRHERSFPLPPCGRNGAESDQYATLQNHSVTRSASLHSDKQGLSDLEEKESEGQSDLDFQAGITQAFASPKVDQSTALEKAASEVSLVSEGEDPFAALPDELLALILRKCEPEAFLSAWQVSPRWRGVASQVR